MSIENLNELEKSLKFKKFHGDIDSVDYDDLDNYDDNYDFIKKFLRFDINMINLSLDQLKLVAERRNIRDYENKSKKDLIKALSKPKPKIGINKKKLAEIRKDFNELRHKFSKKEIDEYRKS